MNILPVIILHYNSPEKLASCVNSFKKCSETYKPFFIIIDSCSSQVNQCILTSEVISKEKIYVIDNVEHSLTCQFDVEKFNGVYYASKENLGYSRGNNLGFKLANDIGFEFGILANPDTEALSNESICELVGILNCNNNILAVYPQIIGTDGKTFGNNQGPFLSLTYCYLIFIYTLPGRFFKPFFDLKNNILKTISLWRYRNQFYEIYASLGCVIGINIAKFHEVDGFDESFFLYYEEQVLGEKAKKYAAKIVMATKSFFYHNHTYSESNVNIAIAKYSFEIFLKKYKKLNKWQIDLLNNINKIKTNIGKVKLLKNKVSA